MDSAQQSPEQIVERGTRIYEEKLRHILEPAHTGEFVVIDVDTGEYEVDTDHLTASDRAAARRPGAALFATRVGTRTLGRVGRHPATDRK